MKMGEGGGGNAKWEWTGKRRVGGRTKRKKDARDEEEGNKEERAVETARKRDEMKTFID